MSECIPWHGNTGNHGYGLVYKRSSAFGAGNSKWKLAHRHIYEECFGEIPPKTQVHHVCHNRTCVNPEHFELLGIAEHASRHMGGKLDRKTARWIKHRLAAGDRGSDVARDFGVSPQLVCHIRKGRCWADA